MATANFCLTVALDHETEIRFGFAGRDEVIDLASKCPVVEGLRSGHRPVVPLKGRFHLPILGFALVGRVHPVSFP